MSAQGWAGVWHLEEAGAGKSGEYKDATGDYDGTGGGAIPARKEGMVGRSQDFKTTNSGSWITLPRTWDPGSSKFTLQMWIRREGPEEALVRELNEELGISAQIGQRVAQIRHKYRNGGAVDLQFFKVKEFQGPMVNRIFNDMRWVSLAALPGYDFLAADLGLIRDLSEGKLL